MDKDEMMDVANPNPQPLEKLKVGIVGHGFVGKALENGVNDDLDIQIIDPKYKNHGRYNYAY